MNRWKTALVTLAAGGLLVAGGVGLGSAVFAADAPDAESARLSERPGAVRPGPLGDVTHADLELTRIDGSTFSLVLDRGRVVARSEGQVMVVRADGETLTIRVDDETIVRDGLRPSTLEALDVGDRAMFFSEREPDGSLRAVLVRCITDLPERLGLHPHGRDARST